MLKVEVAIDHELPCVVYLYNLCHTSLLQCHDLFSSSSSLVYAILLNSDLDNKDFVVYFHPSNGQTLTSLIVLAIPRVTCYSNLPG